MMVFCRSYLSMLVLMLAFPVMRVEAAVTQDLSYNVFLDGSRIGYHRVSIEQQASVKIVRTEARFNVKFLFINAYDYMHAAKEIWEDGCLVSIQSQTDDNGNKLFLHGQDRQQTFIVETGNGSESVSGCVKSFAYWDLDMINATHLLNSQNGKYTAVDIVKVGSGEIQLGQNRVSASHYRISSDEFTIDLWYSGNKEWLALSTTTESGSTLRYERY